MSRHSAPLSVSHAARRAEDLSGCDAGDEVNDVMKSGLAQLVEMSAHIKETFEAATGAYASVRSHSLSISRFRR